MNCYGEVVTLIDPNADVIKDPAVQRILKGLDGERTVVSTIVLFIIIKRKINCIVYLF